MRTAVTRIYVALLGEGTEAWRPVEAAHEGGDCYRILGRNEDPEDERWEFQHGELVRCSLRTFAGGEASLVAVDRA